MSKSKLASILSNKCPKCREGSLFETKGAYRLRTMTNMREKCHVCSEDFKKEPGFYFGAAYVSYALTVAVWVAVYVALYCFNAWGIVDYQFFEHPFKFFISGVVALVVLLPLIYRLSRSIWISMFVKFDDSKKG